MELLGSVSLATDLGTGGLRTGFRSSGGPFRSLAGLAVEPRAYQVEPRAYQIVPLLMALRQRRVGLLIDDDVGIGKTLEATLIAAEQFSSGEKVIALLAVRLLIFGASTKASLLWLDEPLEHLDPKNRRIAASLMTATGKHVRQILVTNLRGDAGTTVGSNHRRASAIRAGVGRLVRRIGRSIGQRATPCPRR